MWTLYDPGSSYRKPLKPSWNSSANLQPQFWLCPTLSALTLWTKSKRGTEAGGLDLKITGMPGSIFYHLHKAPNPVIPELWLHSYISFWGENRSHEMGLTATVPDTEWLHIHTSFQWWFKTLFSTSNLLIMLKCCIILASMELVEGLRCIFLFTCWYYI